MENKIHALTHIIDELTSRKDCCETLQANLFLKNVQVGIFFCNIVYE